MKALTYQGPQDIRLEKIPDPDLVDDTDVIIKVSLTAICGSDLHSYHGRESGLDPGTAMGHEFCGEVIECGKSVRKFQPGDMVFCPFTTNCGTCFYCLTGLTARCEKGQLFGYRHREEGLHGGQAEYIRVPLADSTLLKLGGGISMEEGLLLGDVFSTGYYCAFMAEPRPDFTYVVLGCGPVGLMSIVGLRELGAENILALDRVQARLELAARMGATPVNASETDPVELIRDATAGRGADAVLEAVGSEQAQKLAVTLLRFGGILSVAGVHYGSHFAFSPAWAYDHNLVYKTGRCSARHFIQTLLPVAQSKKYPIADIITHKVHLHEGVPAYEMFDKKSDNCVKVCLTIN